MMLPLVNGMRFFHNPRLSALRQPSEFDSGSSNEYPTVRSEDFKIENGLRAVGYQLPTHRYPAIICANLRNLRIGRGELLSVQDHGSKPSDGYRRYTCRTGR